MFNDYGAGDATIRTRRLQAAQTFPAYAGLLRTEARLRRAVSAGEPLQRALANHFQVKPRTIARTRTLNRPLAAATRRTYLQRLDRWPAEYLPRTEADWTVVGADDAAQSFQFSPHRLTSRRTGP